MSFVLNSTLFNEIFHGTCAWKIYQLVGIAYFSKCSSPETGFRPACIHSCCTFEANNKVKELIFTVGNNVE